MAGPSRVRFSSGPTNLGSERGDSESKRSLLIIISSRCSRRRAPAMSAARLVPASLLLRVSPLSGPSFPPHTPRRAPALSFNAKPRAAGSGSSSNFGYAISVPRPWSARCFVDDDRIGPCGRGPATRCSTKRLYSTGLVWLVFLCLKD
jgi:hypothetical protein